MQTWARKAVRSYYDVGDLAFVYDPNTPKTLNEKFVLRWKGPFPIVRRQGAKTYLVRLPYGRHQKLKDVAVTLDRLNQRRGHARSPRWRKIR